MAVLVSRRDVLKGLAGAGVLLAGCSPSPTPGGNTVATPASSAPKRGGTLVLAGLISSALDPHRTTSASDLWMSGLGYSQLMRWPKDPNLGLTPVPELAESWEVMPDGLTVILKLRPGVKFQNVAPVNGREFTAEDAKWSIDRWRSNQPYFPRRAIWEPVSAVDVVDPRTLRFTLSKPWPEILINLAQPFSKMLAREAVEAAGDDAKFNSDWKLHIGTGPYILRDYQRDVGAKYVRNPEYWKSGQPYADEVQVRWFADQTARFAAIRAGDVADHGWQLTATQNQILKTIPTVVTAERPGTGWHALMFNLRHKPFDDVRVRRAIALAIDAEPIAKGGWQGGATANRTAIPTAFKDDALPASEWPRQDVARAKALLAEAGFPNGFKFTMMNASPQEQPVLSGQQIKEQLAAIGIEVTLDLTDFTTFIARAGRKEFEANLVGTWAGDVMPAAYLNTFYGSTSPRNYMSYSNGRFDSQLTELNRTFDAAKRRDLMFQLQRILHEDMPVVHLVVQTDYYAWQTWLKGYGTNWIPGAMHSYVDEFWLDK